jgi:hypothetical protein
MVGPDDLDGCGSSYLTLVSFDDILRRGGKYC